MPPRNNSKASSAERLLATAANKTISQQHAEWMGILRPDGPFLSVPALTAEFPQYLDQVQRDKLDKLRLAWAEVRESPDTLTPAWCELVLADLLSYTPQFRAEGTGLPEGLASGPGIRPDAVIYGPDSAGGRTERLLVYRRPYDQQLTKATRKEPSPAEQAAALCRARGVPLALLTNGAHWVLIHARPGEPTTTADFDADYWLEVRDLIHAFYSLLRSPFVAAGHLAGLFKKSADAQAEVTSTLGDQVAQAVELLVAEVSRLDRESGGTLLRDPVNGDVEPRQVYRGALTVMMRLVFLLYAEERELLPVDSELYLDSYSVTALYDQLEHDRNLHGDQVASLRAAAWPRLLATFAAIYGGCEHDLMRIMPYGGGMFDPVRYPWLERVAISDLVTAEALQALLFLRRKGSTAERLSYKGLNVEQIGHVYEGLLEFGCERATEPHVGLIGKRDRQVALSDIEVEAVGDDQHFESWLVKESGATASQIHKALDEPRVDEATLDAACDNDKDLSARIWPFRALLRPDLRGHPTVFPAGSLFITHDGDRRTTGTHYTPRDLAEKIVRHTLEPLCYSPGPAEGVPADEKNVRPAADLIKLKVLDPAMGSGAFLVSACRYLAERLVSAWTRDGYPEVVSNMLGAEFDREDALREASRWVAARCLYGVDRDEAAVELGKLSLWLATLSKGKPFSFLDHALRWGDSLLGFTTEEQVRAFHLDPATGYRIHRRLTDDITSITEPMIARITELRQQIEQEPVRDATMGTKLSAKLAEADELIAKLRTEGDAVAAAALSTAGEPATRFDERLTDLTDAVQRILRDDSRESPLEQAFRERLKPWLQGDRKEPIRPFHWPLEFPEVVDNGGFSAIVSNPPFMGGQTLRERIGNDFREYLVNYVARGKRGSADLCSYFLLRNLSVAKKGRVGIIATNTIAQGDTREVGLDQATTDLNWTIYRADKSQPWPGTASLEVSLVWMGHASPAEERFLDDTVVTGITPSLDPKSRVTGNPYRLEANKGKSFVGSYVLGSGFVVTLGEAQMMIREDPKNEEVLFPYLNGETLNTEPDSAATRWVINFGDMDDMDAAGYQRPWDRVVQQVRPFRMQNNRKVYRDRWWQYAERRPAMLRAIDGLDRVLVIAQTSRTQIPALVSARQVLSHMLVVIATDRASSLAFHSSGFQYSWTAKYSAGLKADLRYFPSDCFETFPQPTHTDRMTEVGDALDTLRSPIMLRREAGLTRLYNDVHDESNNEPDIVRIREIHLKIDEAVREAYALDDEREPEIREFEARVASNSLPSWEEIDLAHGFHKTPQGVRFTISPQARTDILDKLLALNHYRHQQEQRSGLGTPRPKHKSIRQAKASPDSSVDGALFDPPDTLF